MSADASRWVKIAESVASIPFGDNHMAEVEADGKTICVGWYQEKVFAFARKCPHASGLFIGGHIDTMGNVVCPLHRYRFSLRNGRNVGIDGDYMKTWPVEVREDGVYVGFKKEGLFSWR